MVADGTTRCSTGIRSRKNIKSWREASEYLHRLGRARFLRREGSVLTCDMVALRQEVEKDDVGQWQRLPIAVGYCSCGAAYPSRVQRGGNREARRRRQRANRESLRDVGTISRTLAQSLSPYQGGSDLRNPEIAGKLQILRDFSSFSVVDGNKNLSQKDVPMYVGLKSHTSSVETKNLEKPEKTGVEEKSAKIQKKERQVEDGLLLVVSASIYGKPVRALIDSGATRCFVTPTCVAAVG